jgi:phosphate transport system substrate-binding protein
MRKLVWTLIIAALALQGVLLAANDDLVVVVNKENSVSNLTKSQLRKLILGEQLSWPSGAKVMVVMRTPGTDEREGVLRTVCRMSEEAYSTHLKSIVSLYRSMSMSAGSSIGPKSMETNAAVRALVATNPGAIGFLRSNELNDSVKTLSVDGASPGTPGYAVKAGH